MEVIGIVKSLSFGDLLGLKVFLRRKAVDFVGD
jgi:hypothetical protein